MQLYPIQTTIQANSQNKPSCIPPLKMEKVWLFLPLLFLHFTSTTHAASFGVGGRIGIGIGNAGGGGVWIGGGVTTPNPSGSSSISKAGNAYTALQTWKSAITDDPFRILETWIGTNVCVYKGVFCEMGYVTGIDLNHGNLQGVLVKELSLLAEDLTLLHLNSNRFTDTLPNSFKDLSSLQELDLSNNHFTGTFPTVTLYIPNLIYLDLRFNSFKGYIPAELFNKRLDAIFLNDNQFEGEIPQNLGNSPASVINLANNNLIGNIPASIGFGSSKLKEILFTNNQLTGCLPEGIGLFTDIQVFDASYNALMGHLPDTVSCLDEIEVLNLAHNRFSGVLPNLVCSLRNLMNLTVAYNFFSGFSQECSKLFERNVGFDFSLNCIPGRDMQRPQPDCSSTPGGGLNCLRIPTVGPIVCGTLLAEILRGGSAYPPRPRGDKENGNS